MKLLKKNVINKGYNKTLFSKIFDCEYGTKVLDRKHNEVGKVVKHYQIGNYEYAKVEFPFERVVKFKDLGDSKFEDDRYQILN